MTSDLYYFDTINVGETFNRTALDKKYDRFVLEYNNKVMDVLGLKDFSGDQEEEKIILGEKIDYTNTLQVGGKYWDIYQDNETLENRLANQEIILCIKVDEEPDVTFNYGMERIDYFKYTTPSYRTRILDNKEKCFKTHVTIDKSHKISTFNFVMSLEKEKQNETENINYTLRTYVLSVASQFYRSINIAILPENGETEFVLDYQNTSKNILISPIGIECPGGLVSERSVNEIAYKVKCYYDELNSDSHNIPEDKCEEECEGLKMFPWNGKVNHYYITKSESGTLCEQGQGFLILGLNAANYVLLNDTNRFSDSYDFLTNNIGGNESMADKLDTLQSVESFIVADSSNKTSKFDIMSHDNDVFICVSRINLGPCIPIMGSSEISKCWNECGTLEIDTNRFTCLEKEKEILTSDNVNTFVCLIKEGHHAILENTFGTSLVTFFNSNLYSRATLKRDFSIRYLVEDEDNPDNFSDENLNVEISKNVIKWNDLNKSSTGSYNFSYNIFSITVESGDDVDYSLWKVLNRGKEITSDKKCGNGNRCSADVPRSEDEHTICIVAISNNNTSVPPLYQCDIFEFNVPTTLIAGIAVFVIVIVVLLVVFVVLTYRYYKNKSFIKAVKRVEDDTLTGSQNDTISFVEDIISDTSELDDGGGEDNVEEEEEEEGYDEYDDIYDTDGDM